jgi:hypothetical protein
MNEESEELIHGINKTFKHELGGAYGNWVFERYTAVKIDVETLENNFLNHWGKE